MLALLVLIAALAIAATGATVHAVATDGYGAVPTRRF